MLVEIGDIARFRSPDMMAEYAGIDATVQQSAHFQPMEIQMSKRGSPYLRLAYRADCRKLLIRISTNLTEKMRLTRLR